jgi:hypothetical protein
MCCPGGQRITHNIGHIGDALPLRDNTSYKSIPKIAHKKTFQMTV